MRPQVELAVDGGGFYKKGIAAGGDILAVQEERKRKSFGGYWGDGGVLRVKFRGVGRTRLGRLAIEALEIEVFSHSVCNLLVASAAPGGALRPS